MDECFSEEPVALVSNQELSRKMDRQALRLLGYPNVTALSSSSAAVDFIVKLCPVLVVAGGPLDDMDCIAFLRALKASRKQNPPVVVVTQENREQYVLDAIVAGCSGYVLRPYTMETFGKHIENAIALKSFLEIEQEQLLVAQELLDAGDHDAAIAEFDEVLESGDEAQRYFNQGIKALGQKKYGQAIIAFNKALKLSELFAEAYKGMAEAYRGKGDLSKYEENLKRAAEIFAQQDRFEETKLIFADILKVHSSAINPYNSLGVALRKRGDLHGAINAYKQAIALTPNDENVYFNIAKACYTAGQPARAKKYAAEALRLNPGFCEAQRLISVLQGRPHAAAQADECPAPSRDNGAWNTELDQ
jgi:tetratricopeptide (TPR) repeat protein